MTVRAIHYTEVRASVHVFSVKDHPACAYSFN